MKFCISFGIFDLKYLFYCILFLIVEILIYLSIFYKNKDDDENIINKHKLLDPSCFYLGYLLNFFPEWITNRNSKKKKNTYNK